MNKLSPTSKWLILAAAVVVIIIIIAFYGGNGMNPNMPGGSNGTSTAASGGGANTTAGTQAVANTEGTGTGSAGTGSGSTKTGSTGATGSTGGATSKSSILLLTPTVNDVWVADSQNTVQWSRAAGVTGEIDLMTAGSPATLVGVILNNTGANQTSFTWNTRDLLQSRTSPVKITVAPGTYIVRVSFDGNNLSPITSPSFTIIANTSTVR